MTPPSLRLLLLLRYGERHIDEKLRAVTSWARDAWPEHAVTVIDSGSEFKRTQSTHHGKMTPWIRYVCYEQHSDGTPVFHAFAVLDPVVGHATGVIAQHGLSTGRYTYVLDWPLVEAADREGFTGCPFDFASACGRVQTVTGVDALPGAGRHDWRLVCG